MKTITVLLKATNEIDAVDDAENGHRAVIETLQPEVVITPNGTATGA